MFYPSGKNRRLKSGKLFDKASRRFVHGNTLPEYIFIAIFLILVCVGALQLLSSNVSTAMAKMRDDMQKHQQSAQSVLAAEQAAAAAAASGASGSGAGLTTAQTALLQQSLADKVQTTGANGATELLANQISATAVLLLQQGKINTIQYDILMQLANQGHLIAQIQGLIAGAVKTSNGDYTTFNNAMVDFNGQSYTAQQLASMIGVNQLQPKDFADGNILNTSIGVVTSETDPVAEPELGTFLSLYNQAIASGALPDPSALATVNSASIQIASLGEMTEDNIREFQLGNTDDPAALDVSGAQAITNANSGEICTTGSFQDNGVMCSP